MQTPANFYPNMTAINQPLIEAFADQSAYDDITKGRLKKLPLYRWKQAARMTGPIERVSKRAYRVDRYNLEKVAETIILYDFKIEVPDPEHKYVYGVVTVAIPEGFELFGGVMVANQLYHETVYGIETMVVNASEVEMFVPFNSYNDLVLLYPEFRKTVKMFNRIVKYLEEEKIK